ncbi:hypothetical protein EP7_002991 [Isosphaeraceae bacterium EP7]
MQMIGVLLLAAATAGAGFGKPGVGGKKLLRHHAVVSGEAPPGGPIQPPMGGGGPGGPGQAGRRFPSVRSQIYFLDPDGMKIGWQTSGGPNGEKAYLPAQLEVPARYNFMQGFIYRLKITDIPNRPNTALYPTLEVAPSTPATDAYLTHNPIPVQFTAEDFEQVVDGGNFVTKVIYLPDPKYQELAIAGVETLVSTRLEPGVDPILEADKRGTILLIVRLGQIDLEMQQGGAPIIGGPVNSAPGIVSTPGTLPPGVISSTPIESAPVSPASPIESSVPADAPAPAPAPASPEAATLPPVPSAPSPSIPEVEAPAVAPAPTPESEAFLAPPSAPALAEVPVPVPAPN